jgi:hypothetical protein
MGFFSSKKTTKTSSTYDNPELRQYTDAYRGAAPWGFATLDPEATLLAMGKGTKLGGQDLGVDAKKHLEGLSDIEKKEAEASQQALERIQERQTSGQFLTPQETEFVNQQLDKAFESSRKIAFEDWTRGAQQLAGSRGLRMSDTPVADPAMRALRDMELGFASQRAGMGLDATMKLSGQQQAFDQQLRDSLETLKMNRWSTRQAHLFGGGLDAASRLGFKQTGKTTEKQGMSGLQKVTGTMSMIDQGLDLGGKIAGMAGGGMTNMASLSSMGGGGGGQGNWLGVYGQ